MPLFDTGQNIGLAVHLPELAEFAIEAVADGFENSRRGNGD